MRAARVEGRNTHPKPTCHSKSLASAIRRERPTGPAEEPLCVHGERARAIGGALPLFAFSGLIWYLISTPSNEMPFPISYYVSESSDPPGGPVDGGGVSIVL